MEKLKYIMLKNVLSTFLLATALLATFIYSDVRGFYNTDDPVSTVSGSVSQDLVEVEDVRDIIVIEAPVPMQNQKEDSIERKIFGYSENGRAIYGYEIGDSKNCLLLIAGAHGREKGGKDLLDKLLEEVLAYPNLIDSEQRLIIIPLMNPDGYYGQEDKVNANGVNLNRNFYTSSWVRQSSADETTYAGPKPFSESETRVVKEVAESCQSGVMIAFHSQGHLASPEVGARSLALARWYADKTGYHYFDEWDYAGTVTRWFEERVGGAAMTVELTNHIDSDWEINKEALLELISLNLKS